MQIFIYPYLCLNILAASASFNFVKKNSLSVTSEALFSISCMNAFTRVVTYCSCCGFSGMGTMSDLNPESISKRHGKAAKKHLPELLFDVVRQTVPHFQREVFAVDGTDLLEGVLGEQLRLCPQTHDAGTRGLCARGSRRRLLIKPTQEHTYTACVATKVTDSKRVRTNNQTERLLLRTDLYRRETMLLVRCTLRKLHVTIRRLYVLK